jgi:hypothetical protein
MDSISPKGEVGADDRGLVDLFMQPSNLELLEQGHLGQLIEFQISVDEYSRHREP